MGEEGMMAWVWRWRVGGEEVRRWRWMMVTMRMDRRIR